MINFVMTVAVIALVASWIILLIGKNGLMEYLQIYSPKLISEMFSCDFCLSWWVGVALSVCFAIATGDWILLLCPFCTTPLTRILL